MNNKIQDGVDLLFTDGIIETNDSLVEFLVKIKRINKQNLGIWLSEPKNEEVLKLYISKVT